jgi:hypothetical protein
MNNSNFYNIYLYLFIFVFVSKVITYNRNFNPRIFRSFDNPFISINSYWANLLIIEATHHI